MLSWVFGEVKQNTVHVHTHDRASGYLEFEKARVRWFLSINYDVLPDEIKAESNIPQLAAQLVKNGENILQKQIIAIKTKSSLELLAYLEEQYTIKNNLLIESQDNLADFKDRNLNISRSSFSNTQTRLESELQTATAVFQNIVTQLEQVKLQVAKDTPVFSFLKPVVVPIEKSAPKRSLIVIVWLFLGFVVSIGYILAKEPVIEFIKEINDNKS